MIIRKSRHLREAFIAGYKAAKHLHRQQIRRTLTESVSLTDLKSLLNRIGPATGWNRPVKDPSPKTTRSFSRGAFILFHTVEDTAVYIRALAQSDVVEVFDLVHADYDRNYENSDQLFLSTESEFVPVNDLKDYLENRNQEVRHGKLSRFKSPNRTAPVDI